MDCQNVEETRNSMQKSGRKKCAHFFQRMFHLHFHLKSIGCSSSLYYLSRQTELSAKCVSPVFIDILSVRAPVGALPYGRFSHIRYLFLKAGSLPTFPGVIPVAQHTSVDAFGTDGRCLKMLDHASHRIRLHSLKVLLHHTVELLAAQILPAPFPPLFSSESTL